SPRPAYPISSSQTRLLRVVMTRCYPTLQAMTFGPSFSGLAAGWEPMAPSLGSGREIRRPLLRLIILRGFRASFDFEGLSGPRSAPRDATSDPSGRTELF